VRRLTTPGALLALSSLLPAQTYTIKTIAGGGAPENIVGTSARLQNVAGVAVDAGGNAYISLSGAYVVLRLDATTRMLKLFAGNGTAGYSGDTGPATNAQLVPGGLAVDATGNLYISDSLSCVVRKVSSGTITTVAGNGTCGYTGDKGPALSAQLYPGALAVDASGNLYVADGENNVVRKVSNGTIITVAGNGNAGYSGDNGLATGAQLYNPWNVAVDAAGKTLYIADQGNYRVRMVSNGTIVTVAGNGTGGYSGDNGPATSAQLYAGPLALDASGNLYVDDGFRVRKVANGLITTIAGNGNQGDNASQAGNGDGGPATSAELSGPSPLAVDPAGNVYIAEPDYIRMVSNGVINTIAGGGTSIGDGLPATAGQLWAPIGIALDATGSLYIADLGDSRIRRVAGGVIDTVAGDGTLGFGGDNGPATQAQLNYAYGVAVDGVGNVYITDLRNDRIRQVSNGTITTIAGGAQGYAGDNGPEKAAQMFGPEGIVADALGNLYFADTGNYRVRKVSGGLITTIAGNGTQGDSGDNGPATDAQLSPSAVAVDSDGNLYIADDVHNRVRMVSNGIITTVAGNGTAPAVEQTTRGDNGPATNAQVFLPDAVAVDGTGSLYIAERDSLIRKVSNGIISTIAGGGSSLGENVPATSARLLEPYGLAVDTNGNVYVSMEIGGRVELLTPSGKGCTSTVSPASVTPSASGGAFTASVQTTSGCPWAIQGMPSWIQYAGNATAVGPGAVTLNVTANIGPLRRALVSVAGRTILVTQQGSSPQISAGGVVNAASFLAAPMAPGSIATVFGTFPVTGVLQAGGYPLPVALGGLSMQFPNALNAPLFAATGGLVNIQVPWELAGQSQAALTAVAGGQTSAPETVGLAAYSPGIFSMNSQGTGQGAILDPSYRLVDVSNPAKAGSTVVQIYCTGLGAVSNQPSTGAPAPAGPLSWTLSTPTVSIGGAPAVVEFSGLTPYAAGLYQVNALVPANSATGNTVPVTVAIGGLTSNTVTMTVR